MFSLNYFLSMEITSAHFQVGAKTKNRSNKHKMKILIPIILFTTLLNYDNVFLRISKWLKINKNTIPELLVGH